MHQVQLSDIDMALIKSALPELWERLAAEIARGAPAQTVEITMDGGLIQSLKAPRGVNVTVRDYDVEGSDEIVRKDANGDEFIEFGWEGNGEWQ
jgi:hypothetical protein